MNKKTVLKFTLTAITCILILYLIGTLVFLFAIDRKKDEIYTVAINQFFLSVRAEALYNTIEVGECRQQAFENNDVEGYIDIECKAYDKTEFDQQMTELSKQQLYGNHIVVDDDTEFFVYDGKYIPIVDSLLYGWYDYEDNFIKTYYGKETAETLPNFRNFFRFNIREKDKVIDLKVFCNTDDVANAVNAVVDFYNN